MQLMPPAAAPGSSRFRGLARRLLTLVIAFFAVPLLTSCYVPNDFVAEIRLSKSGDFAMIYQGNLTWAPLFKEIREGKLSAAEIEEKEQALTKDLSRDSNFTEVTPLGSGTFHVRYEVSGRFTGTRAVTFVRRSSALMTMELKPDGTVHIWASQDPKLRDPEQLESLGLRTQGRLRVITNAYVIKNNAYKVSSSLPEYPSYKVYDWSINSVRTPKPFLIAHLFSADYMARQGTPPP
jgi:hypothetical protein